MSFMDNKEELQRGLGHWEGLTGEAVDESEWREGDVGQATLNRTLISLSTQYEWEQLYFCISNVSHWCELITTHCTDTVHPAASMSLRNCSLTLWAQVTLFTQRRFNTEQSVCDLGHFQQFRQHLIEPAAIHMQWCSQNLVKPVPPPYYCDDIVVLFIVLYCITITVVSRLTCPVAGTTSHTTHRAARLLSQVASLYSLLFSLALYCWCTHKFYLHMTMSCSPADHTRGQWWFHCEVCTCDSHLVFSLPVLIKINKQKFPQSRPCRASSTWTLLFTSKPQPLLSLNISLLTISPRLSLRSASHH